MMFAQALYLDRRCHYFTDRKFPRIDRTKSNLR